MSKNLKTIIIVGLVAVIGTLTVAYATLGQTLTINGSATVNRSTWNVALAVPTSACTTTGSATATQPTVSGTTATLNGVTLSKPGDSVSCIVNVTNSGTIAARLSGFTPKTMSLSSTTSGVTASDFTYSVTYDGSATPLSDSTKTPLAVGTTKAVVITITFNSSSTTVASSAVTINNLGATLNYVQA